MKCQSDYDGEDQAIFRQSDECVEAWWDGESKATDDRPPEVEETDPPMNTAETEAIRRGLLKQEESGDLCVSCPERAD
jgi:hypothetical protein